MPRLRKRLGQHHLRHPHLCSPAIDFLEPAGRTVVEVGPGGGVLTRELLAAGAEVMAVELDPAWAFDLAAAVDSARLRLWIGDALDIPWSRLAVGTRVAGNLPYAVATPIVESLLMTGLGVDRAAFLIQEEVARRLCAQPGSRDYGLLAVLARSLAAPRILSRVEPGSFRPAPRVAGAFVGLERINPPLAPAEMPAFRRTLAAVFRHRRKTIANSLRESWGRETTARRLAAAGIDAGVRADRLDPAQLVALHQAP